MQQMDLWIIHWQYSEFMATLLTASVPLQG